MAGEIVSWMDYQGLANQGGLMAEGGEAIGGISSMADVDALNKALEAGSDINSPGTAAGEGFPLRVESLDQTLFNTTYKAKDVKFWKALYKDPAYNTVEEYNRLEEYGSGDAIFISEGDLPEEDDSTYSRQYTRIKFMGTTRRVTHVMSVLRTAHGDAMARETVNGTMFLLRQIERAMFYGDEDLVSIQFDGLEKLLVSAWGATVQDDGMLSGYEDDEHVIDCSGNPLSEDYITDMAELLVAEPNYGAPTDLWTDTGATKDLSKIMYPKERYDLPAPTGGKAGINISAVATPFGDINLNPNIFIVASKTPVAAGVGRAGVRPTTPTISGVTSPAYAGAGSKSFTATWAGAYWYKVCAGSRYGKSAPATSAQLTVSAGDQASIAVVDNGPNTSYYEVYRSDKDGAATTCRTIFRVARSAAAQTIVDLNRFHPNTSKAYMLSQSSEVLKWKQLAPFTRIPLATIDTSVRWMQVIYGALQIMMPKKCGMFVNVGRLATGRHA